MTSSIHNMAVAEQATMFVTRCRSLAALFKVQTQEQYNEGELCKKLDEDLSLLAIKLDDATGCRLEIHRSVCTIWGSSRCASNVMVALALSLLSDKVESEL